MKLQSNRSWGNQIVFGGHVAKPSELTAAVVSRQLSAVRAPCRDAFCTSTVSLRFVMVSACSSICCFVRATSSSVFAAEESI